MPRIAWVALAGLVGLPAMVCLGVMGSVFSSFPPHQGPLVEAGAIQGVDADGAYAWIVPTATGVVLVDVGLDADATALRDAIGARHVRGILITHAHLDHIAGLPAFPEVPVYVGPGEAALLTGQRSPQGFMARVFGSLMGDLPPVPAALHELAHGDVVELDGHAFAAIHLPGHTPGSTAWLWNDVLFSGDSLLGFGDRVAPTHALFADDHAQNVAAIQRLTELRINRMADGHAGFHHDVGPLIGAFVAQ